MGRFHRSYRVDSDTTGLRVNIKQFKEVTGSPQRSDVGTVTVTADATTEWVGKLQKFMLVDGVQPDGTPAQFWRPTKVFTLGADGQIIPRRTMLLEKWVQVDGSFSGDVGFQGRYSECLLETQIVPLNTGGVDYLASPAPDGSMQSLPLPISEILTRVLAQIKLDGGPQDWTLDIRGTLPTVALDVQKGTTTFLGLLNGYYESKAVDFWTEWDESGYRIVVAPYSQGGNDVSDQVRFVRGVVTKKPQRTVDPTNLATEVVVRGKYGSIGRAVNSAALAIRTAVGLGRVQAFVDRTDVYDDATAQDLANRLLPYVSGIVPVVEHEELDTDVSGTPIPDVDFFLNDKVDSYTNSVTHEIREVQRLDESVTRNGERCVYTLSVGANERDIQPIAKADPSLSNAATTTSTNDPESPTYVPSPGSGGGTDPGDGGGVSDSLEPGDIGQVLMYLDDGIENGSQSKKIGPAPASFSEGVFLAESGQFQQQVEATRVQSNGDVYAQQSCEAATFKIGHNLQTSPILSSGSDDSGYLNGTRLIITFSSGFDQNGEPYGATVAGQSGSPWLSVNSTFDGINPSSAAGPDGGQAVPVQGLIPTSPALPDSGRWVMTVGSVPNQPDFQSMQAALAWDGYYPAIDPNGTWNGYDFWNISTVATIQNWPRIRVGHGGAGGLSEDIRPYTYAANADSIFRWQGSAGTGVSSGDTMTWFVNNAQVVQGTVVGGQGDTLTCEVTISGAYLPELTTSSGGSSDLILSVSTESGYRYTRPTSLVPGFNQEVSISPGRVTVDQDQVFTVQTTHSDGTVFTPIWDGVKLDYGAGTVSGGFAYVTVHASAINSVGQHQLDIDISGVTTTGISVTVVNSTS